jgi:hypothetical protein
VHQFTRELAKRLLDSGPRKVVPTSRRVRVLFNHSYIVDTTSAVHVWEHDGFPQFYIPQTALRNCTWTDEEPIKASKDSSSASMIKITVPGSNGLQEKSTDTAILFHDGAAEGKLSGLVRLEFGAMGMYLTLVNLRCLSDY